MREGGREGGREEEREGGRKRGREGGREVSTYTTARSSQNTKMPRKQALTMLARNIVRQKIHTMLCACRYAAITV